MQTPSVRIPDPKCDGQYLGVPLVFRWEVLSRPSGSAAVLSQTTTTTAHLTPDVAGDWQVVFTACPFGCKVTGTTITVGPLRRTITCAGLRSRTAHGDEIESAFGLVVVVIA
jgi:hypothetical protein